MTIKYLEEPQLGSWEPLWFSFITQSEKKLYLWGYFDQNDSNTYPIRKIHIHKIQLAKYN